MNDKDAQESQKAQTNKRILEMERRCHEQIKEQEKGAQAEILWKLEFEKNIQQLRQNANTETLFSKVLEKTIYDKARDKMKQGKKTDEEETTGTQEKDYLAPILKKLGFGTQELNEEAAIMVKNEALRNLKERLLTRAEIIQRRLEDEQKLLEQAYANLRRKGENQNAEDEKNYEREVQKANFRIEILTERASTHYKQSLTKFEELNDKLSRDSRLAAINKKNV